MFKKCYRYPQFLILDKPFVFALKGNFDKRSGFEDDKMYKMIYFLGRVEKP